MAVWLTDFVARLPAGIHAKLLAAFSVIVALLIIVGAAGLQALGEANRRAEEQVILQRKIAAYRQFQHDITSQLYSVAAALLVPDDRALDATLRQLNQFGYDFDRLQFVARDEVELLGQIQADYDQFTQIVTRVVELTRAGQPEAGHRLQQSRAAPLAERLERLTNGLVNKAEADMVARIDANQTAYLTSRNAVIGFAVGSIGLALLLGYAISWSLISPIRQMATRLRRLTTGDFAGRVEVANRDELGALATDLNHMSAELGRLYAQLDAANRNKSEFLASMSHELRTPLNAIIGFSEVLLEQYFGEVNDKQAEYLQDILTSGRHLLSLINDILDLAKVEAGRMELEIGQLSLAEAIENGLMMVRERAARADVTLGREVDPDIGLIEADERKIKQILFNLLTNAVKFTPPGGRVDLVARQIGVEVEVAVRDTGVGIAPEHQELIFEEFRQVGDGHTHKQEGTGLGLALTRRLVELHGGKIWVESEPGVGSVFTFVIPARRPVGWPGEVASPIDSPPASKQFALQSGGDGASGDVNARYAGLYAKVVEPEVLLGAENGESALGRPTRANSVTPLALLVEDDPRAADLLNLYLTSDGFEVVVTTNAAEAIILARKLHPAVVTLDIMLPGGDGWEILTRLKSDPTCADIAVVVVSMLDERGKGFALGADDYLVKPIARDDLLRIVARLRRERQAARAATVLAIDDDAIAIELIAAILGPEGYTVLRADGGESGLALALEHRPTLVIVDLLMPGLDGFAVVERLRADPTTADTPIIVLTALTMSDEARARLNGQISYLAHKTEFDRAAFLGLVRGLSPVGAA